jgi:hypothetical protein
MLVAAIADGKEEKHSIADSTALQLLRYEYAYYMAGSDNEKYDALYAKVLCCMKMLEFKKANYEINRIETLDNTVLQKKYFLHNLQQLMFEYGLYSACLDFINRDTADGFNRQRSLMKALCLNKENSYSALKQELSLAAIKMGKDTQAIFIKIRNPESLKKNNSALMQALLPGLGMVNEGEVAEGITSFLLNGILVAAPIVLIKHQFYANAFTYGLFPLAKFYPGGIKHTKYLVQKNQDQQSETIRAANAAFIFEFYQTK